MSFIQKLFDASVRMGIGEDSKQPYYVIHASSVEGDRPECFMFSWSSLGQATKKGAVAKPFKLGSNLQANCSLKGKEAVINSFTVVEEGWGEAKVYEVEKRARGAQPKAQQKTDEPKGDGTYGVSDIS